MILITGATGPLGFNTIKYLIEKGVSSKEISAMVRNEAKAGDLKALGVDIKIADYNDSNSLLKAFVDVQKLLLVSGSDIVNRGKQHENVVNAAKESGVKHILYTSFDRKNETDTSPIALVAKAHINTEVLIKSSGTPYTIFRNSLYSDYVPLFLGDQVASTGVFYPAGDGKIACATRENMAEAIASVLATEGHENKEYVLSNTETVDFNDIADYLSGIFRKELKNVNPSVEVFSATLKEAGIPEDQIGMATAFAEAIRQGEFSNTSNDIEALTGRTPTTLKTFLTQVYSN